MPPAQVTVAPVWAKAKGRRLKAKTNRNRARGGRPSGAAVRPIRFVLVAVGMAVVRMGRPADLPVGNRGWRMFEFIASVISWRSEGFDYRPQKRFARRAKRVMACPCPRVEIQ